MSHQPTLLHDETSAEQATRAAERAKYLEQLRDHLRDPNFRAIEGFPIGTLSLLCTVIDPVPGDVADHARTVARADPQARHLSGTPADRDVELLLPATLS